MVKKVLIAVTGLLVATNSIADGRSAAHNLFTNLARARASLSVNEATSLVGPTLVKGIYTLSNQQGRFVGFTNESGNLFGDSRGFQVLPSNGAQPRPLTLDEINDLRAEVVSAIDYDKLPRIVFGDGGGRRLVLFSAVDCPFCKGFEDNMRKHAVGLNSTLYVVPSSLQKIAQGGMPQWQAVSRIWCADDAGAAWQAFWTSRVIPQPRQCRFADPRTAEIADQQLKDILQAVGVRVVGTPQILREDGTAIANRSDMNSAYVSATFGSAGVPPANVKPARWLTASAEDSFQMQPVGSQPSYAQPTQQAPQQKQHFGINDALNLKRLLGK